MMQSPNLFSTPSLPEIEQRGSLPSIGGNLGELTPDEKSLRLANLVTPYGVGTHSYNRSSEKRELDRQRAETTAAHEAAPHQEILVGPICACPQRPYPHELSIHSKLSNEFHDPRFRALRDLWPWSLVKSGVVEESTERGF